jgi:hypothetical protein
MQIPPPICLAVTGTTIYRSCSVGRVEGKAASFTPITHVISLVDPTVGIIVKSRYLTVFQRSEKVIEFYRHYILMVVLARVIFSLLYFTEIEENIKKVLK